jgi:hypothetical protein
MSDRRKNIDAGRLIRSAVWPVSLTRPQELSAAVIFDKRQYLQRFLQTEFGFATCNVAVGKQVGNATVLENAAAMAPRSAADTAPVRRRIKRVDGRSRAALRVKARLASYAERLGAAADAVALTERRKAAELAVVADDLRAARLRGEPVDLNELHKAQGYADRAERALGLDNARRRIGATPTATSGRSLLEILDQRDQLRAKA